MARATRNGGEPYAFRKEGEAPDLMQNGRIELDGELPLNIFGGSPGAGRMPRPLADHRSALQASGCAGSRQFKYASVSFVGASASVVPD